MELKELEVADFDGDCDDEPLTMPLEEERSFPFTMLVLLWLWFIEVLVVGSRLRKCLNEKGFSLGASVDCLKSVNNTKCK